MTMNKAEYDAYVKSVEDFFTKENIANLSPGHLSCPVCGPNDYEESLAWNDDDQCPECGCEREAANDPYFSWTYCECCQQPLGGNRQHATGANNDTHEIQEYEVCEDCIYFAEYGRLDDTTMMNLEEE